MEWQSSGSLHWWLLLAAGLFFFSFGQFGLLICLYGLCFLSGGVLIAGIYSRSLSRSILALVLRTCPGSPSGNKAVRSAMEPMTRVKNFDKRMTGASVIDDAMKEVLEFTVRDYIKPWYRQLSDHDAFLVDVWQCFQKVVITFASRSKDVDWMPYFTQRLVDDFASHIRLYRRASEKVKNSRTDEQYCQLLEEAFFDMEVEMEDHMCRDLVCTNPEQERQYLQDLSEVLLYLLLPKDDFHSKPFRYITREVLVNGILVPTIDLLSDPDYINQYVAWLCYESSFTNETFLTVIRSSDLPEELEAVRDKVEEDIARWRSKDTGGSEDTMIKQNLNSLIFLRDTCNMRLKRLQEGTTDLEGLEVPDYLRYQSLYVMSLDDILNNNTALQAFIEFTTQAGGQQYLFFYLNVAGFQAAAAQQIQTQKQLGQVSNNSEPDLTALRRAAMIIYDQYLSEKGISRIRIESEFTKGLLQKIKGPVFSEDVFDVVQARVYQILHMNYYEQFLQCTGYVRLLSELGLLNPNQNTAAQDSDSLSLDDGIVKEPDKPGKSYAVFAVTVKKKVPFAEEDIWDVYRRYSDFHDLNMILTEKFPDLQGPTLPGKTMLKNMSKDFLEKRRRALDHYLRALLKPELWQKVPGLEELMAQFLAPGLWEKHKSEFSRKMDTIVNPLRNASKNVGQAVKSVPDGLGKVFSGKASGEEGENDGLASKVGAGLDPEGVDNIPLRIMLLLLDEVFDLRHKNQWPRRRIVAILRRLIKATFGDMINRKIVDHVNFMTSAEQVAEYVRTFRNSFWPNGVLAEVRSPRDEATKMRTRVLCKAKMFGSVPDEMRTMMGTASIQQGTFNVFNMFQHKRLNRRFLFVFLEGVLETLFPENNFDQLFRKQHSRSQRVKDAIDRREKSGLGLSSNNNLRKRLGRR
ncbi:sorting nexin-13-like [Babylonia areolata]|uniref:sorting nexin-13-like n=1 Tax=Babylonia areolata TaxID=304850 RepID=UPI003FCF1F4C